MRLLTFTLKDRDAPRAGVRVGKRILDLAAASREGGHELPSRMRELIAAGPGAMDWVRKLVEAAGAEPTRFLAALLDEDDIRYLPPIPDADKFLCAGKNYRS